MNPACPSLSADLDPPVVRSAAVLSGAPVPPGFPAAEGLHPALGGQKAEPVRAARRHLQPPGRAELGRAPSAPQWGCCKQVGGGKSRGKTCK